MFHVLLGKEGPQFKSKASLEALLETEFGSIPGMIEFDLKDEKQTNAKHLFIKSKVKEKEELKRVVHHLSMALTKYIISEKEQELLFAILKKEPTLDEEDQRHIMSYIRKVPYANPLRRIYQVLYTYLLSNQYINLDGFIQFRLKEYMTQLENRVEIGIDEYLMDQEHQEFVQLLQYFVSIQETKIPLLHVFYHKENEYEIFNEVFDPINLSELVDVPQELESGELIYDDFLISTLITLSPQYIVIHTKIEEDVFVLAMIEDIFEDKVDFCSSCNWCERKREEQAEKKGTVRT